MSVACLSAMKRRRKTAFIEEDMYEFGREIQHLGKWRHY